MHNSQMSDNENNDQRQVLRFDRALLPSGWTRDVTVAIDAHGDIEEVSTGDCAERDGTFIPGCALPGVPNVHSHAHQRAMAGLAEYAGPGADSFWSWRKVMYDFVNRMTAGQLEAVAAQLYVEMLKSGYTAVAEFQYLHHDKDGNPYAQPAEMTLRTCAAARSAGIAMTSLPVLYRYGDFGSAPPQPGQKRFVTDADLYLSILSELDAQAREDPEMRVGMAPHSLRAVSKDLLRVILTGRKNKPCPVHIHIAEQNREVEDCIAWSGQRPVEWLLTNLEVDSSWCLIHATHMTDGETRNLANSGAIAGLCPTTEANLGDGFFPARDFLDQSGQFGIGSDSHISVNPVEELRWLEYGQRLVYRSRNVLAGREEHASTGRRLFDGAVSGGARACGRNTGRIEPGCRADLITLDTDHPLLHGREGDVLLDSWIFSGNGSLVRDVFVGGRHLVSNRNHPLQDTIAGAFRNALDELVKST